MDDTTAVSGRRLSLARITVSAGYAAQGLGYAVVVTALPVLKQRQHLDDTGVSLIILLVCIAAAGGSLLADWLAVHGGSRTAIVVGLLLEAVALPAIASHIPIVPFVLAFAVYGLGLGTVDASAGMQGVLVQKREGRSVMGGFFACYTGAAIVGALLMSAVATTPAGASLALLVATAVAAVVALVGARRFDPERATATTKEQKRRDPLPRTGITIFGMVILAAFVADSAVSTWSTVYLQDGLRLTVVLAPLGYGLYQVAILITRLLADLVVRRAGRIPLAIVTTIVAVVGCCLVAIVPSPIAGLLGFALAGVGVGALVPLAFSSAGELDPARSDEIVARVNLFNYAGAILGAVLPGLLSGSTGLGVAFLIPAVLLVPILVLARHFGQGNETTGGALAAE